MAETEGELRSVGARLRAARHALELTQAQMSRAVGIPQQTFADYENDKSSPSPALCLALEYRFGLNRDWLEEGEGQMFLRQGSRPEFTLPGGPGQLVAGRPVITADPEELKRLTELEGRDRYYAVPYLRDAAAAGAGRIVEDQVAGYCIIHQRVAPRPENLRCVQVSGESMAPTLTDGSIVAVDVARSDPRQLDGSIVCARTEEGEVVIKRLRLQGRYLLLFSDNEDAQKYPTIVVDLEEHPDAVIGQVVWAWVDLR